MYFVRSVMSLARKAANVANKVDRIVGNKVVGAWYKATGAEVGVLSMVMQAGEWLVLDGCINGCNNGVKNKSGQ
jgi:hypothetical protein